MAALLDVLQAAEEFEILLGKLHRRNLPEFFEVVKERIERERSGAGKAKKGSEHAEAACSSRTDDDEANESNVMIRSIAAELRANPLVPPDAVVKSERIYHPTTGEFSALDPNTMVSVDKFLYEDDEAIDEACDEGVLSRNYCLDCGSHRTAPLNFVSHSASLLQLKFIFQKALPDLSGKTVVDIGSRLGPVLYAAYYYSDASRIVGIEINPELCAIQEDIVKKFGLGNRIQVVNADVCTQTALLQKADVVIAHNVFEFFASLEIQISIWKFLKRTLRTKGCLLVTVPSLEKSFAALEMPTDLSSWVKQLPLEHLTMWIQEDEAREEVQMINLYQVV